MHYRLGWPGWKTLGRLGVPIYIQLETLHDAESGVYVVTSKNLPGLVAEISDQASAQEFHRAVDDCIGLLLQTKPLPVKTVTVWPVEIVPA